MVALIGNYRKAAGLLNDTRETSGEARLRYFEWMVGRTRKAGFSLELTTSALSVLDSYIYGFGRQELNLATAEAAPEEMAEAFREALPPDEHPHLNEMVEHQLAHGFDEQAEFDFGLEIILDGLERARDEGWGRVGSRRLLTPRRMVARTSRRCRPAGVYLTATPR